MLSKKRTKKESKIKELIENEKAKDSYVIDDKNAIIVIDNDNKDAHKEKCIMIHKKLVNEKLEETNRWYINSHRFGFIQSITIIKELNLFKIQNSNGKYIALYNYKENKFIIPLNKWDSLEFGHGNKFIELYNGVLAHFSIESDRENDDTYSYTNPITKEKITESFSVKDGNYYAILDLDGTIRGNKLFKGNSFSKIEEIIDLDIYDSLEEFKEDRKNICNEQKEKQKEKYRQMITSRNDNSISPYLDTEVAKILKLKR